MVRVAILALLSIGCGPNAGNYPFVRDAGCERPCEPELRARGLSPGLSTPVLRQEVQ